MTQIDRITLGQYEWTYFAQGQANVLFQSRASLPGKLLRLRLSKPENPSTLEIYNYIRRELRPLHRYMAPVQLVEVDTLLLESLSAYNVDTSESYALLVDEVGFGPQGLVLTLEVEYKLGAALVTTRDFVHEETSNRITVHTLEFKPKWLLQSPNAPEDANYCRTCAVRRMRGKPPSFCPLDLVDHDEQRLRKCCEAMLEGKHDELLEPLVDFFKGSDIFDTIRKVQKSDVKGILGYAPDEDVDDGFNRAMTARDFTVIVEMIKNNDADHENLQDYKVRGQIIDLDLKRYKPGTTKRKHIEQTERALIEDWYRE